MPIPVADVLLDVRESVSDTSLPYRYSDAFILRKVNQTVQRMVVKRPDLFCDVHVLTCVAGSLQSAPADSVRVMDVLSNSANKAVKEINQEVLDLTLPNWENLTPGPATDWMRYPRDPNRFYVYPAAVNADTLTILYAKTPTALTLSSTNIPLPLAYQPAVVDGTLWLLESIDAEHVESGRAKMFQDSFNAVLDSGMVARRLTDTDNAALPKEEQV